MPQNNELYRFTDVRFKGVLKKVIEFFGTRPLLPLPPDQVPHKGIYGLFYYGTYPQYQPLVELNKTQEYPIYIGKAVAAGGRSGGTTVKSISGRLSEHYQSIVCGGLNPSDFKCKFVILDGIYSDLIEASESALVRRYNTLWNVNVTGFGIHAPGSGRLGQQRSEWDTLHPGRQIAERLTGAQRDIDMINRKIADYMAKLKPL